MDLQTFEQEEVAASMFGSAAAFLVPDTTVTVNFAPDGRAVSGVQHALMAGVTLLASSCQSSTSPRLKAQQHHHGISCPAHPLLL